MNIEIEDKLGPSLSQIARDLEGAARERVSQGMGKEVRACIVGHLKELGDSRHATADRLGGKRTGYIADLANNFDQVSTVDVDEDGVSLRLRHPVFSRALHDIDIVAKDKLLAIPMNALAYGRSPLEFSDAFFVHGRDAEIPQDRAAFLLVRSVHQKQDRTLLPTWEEITTAAARGVGREIEAILTEAGLL